MRIFNSAQGGGAEKFFEICEKKIFPYSIDNSPKSAILRVEILYIR